MLISLNPVFLFQRKKKSRLFKDLVRLLDDDHCYIYKFSKQRAGLFSTLTTLCWLLLLIDQSKSSMCRHAGLNKLRPVCAVWIDSFILRLYIKFHEIWLVFLWFSRKKQNTNQQQHTNTVVMTLQPHVNSWEYFGSTICNVKKSWFIFKKRVFTKKILVSEDNFSFMNK